MLAPPNHLDDFMASRARSSLQCSAHGGPCSSAREAHSKDSSSGHSKLRSRRTGSRQIDRREQVSLHPTQCLSHRSGKMLRQTLRHVLPRHRGCLDRLPCRLREPAKCVCVSRRWGSRAHVEIQCGRQDEIAHSDARHCGGAEPTAQRSAGRQLETVVLRN